MDYARLIGDAWTTTWQSRGLWVFGLLAGVTAGSLSIGRVLWPDDPGALAWPSAASPLGWPVAGSPLLSPTPAGSPLLGQAPAGSPLLGPTAAGSSLLGQPADVTLLLVALGAIALLAGLGLLAASVIARGGITQATLELSRGEATSLRGTVRAGARWFWRFFGLLLLLGIVTVLVLASVVPAALRLGVVGAGLGAIALTAGVVASIVLTYAERSIVAHDLAPLAALGAGWRLFWTYPGQSLLAWSLSVGLAFGAAAAATLGLGMVLVLVGGLGLITLAAVIGVLVLLAAVANTYFWSYWTLAYVRLAADNEGQLAAP